MLKITKFGFWHPFLGSTGLTLSEMAMLKLIRYLKIIGKTTVAAIELRPSFFL